MDIGEIIEQYLKPRLREECERLGIPEDFILGVYGGYCKPLEYCSRCDPIDEQGNLIIDKENATVKAVRIKIGDCNSGKPRSALSHFRHELSHAKDWYDGTNYLGMGEEERRRGQSKANWYARRRALEDLGSFIARKFSLSSKHS